MRRTTISVLASMALLNNFTLARGADVPPRSQAGQTLVAPKVHLDQGEIYHIYTGEDAQLLVTSTAQLQRLTVSCRRIVGYFVTPFDRTPDQPPITAGCFPLRLN